ncbi:MAG: ABC transporter permease [Gemmatimonadota bacterium]
MNASAKEALLRLVSLFPRTFRDHFGDDMRADIAHGHDAALERGTAAARWFTLVTGADLLRSALAEHVRPAWRGTPGIHPENETMSTVLQEWSRDLRFAARTLGRSPTFTLVAAGTLGLAIGVTASMYGVVDAVLLDPLPYANTERLVAIRATAPGSNLPEEFGVSDEFFVHYKERSKLLEDLSTSNSFTATMRAGDRVERIRMSDPTNSMYTTLGVKPILGRLPVAADEDNAVVISHALWSEWFGRDPGVVGRVFSVAGKQRVVIGVMGPGFMHPNEDTMLWITGEISPTGIAPGNFESTLIARVKPGTTPEALARELTRLSKELPARFGGSANYAKVIEQHSAVVRTLDEQMLGQVSRPLWVLLGATAIVLLIACFNVANLFMVRTEGRHRELAVRGAIGASRSQLVRLQMAEAVVVATIAAVLALLVAAAGLPVFIGAAPEGVPRLGAIGVDLTLVGFTLGLAFLAAVACGFVPALRASSPDLTRLRDGGRGTTRGRHWGRNGLIVAQTAFALVLLIGSGLLIRSFEKLSNVDPGYSTKDIFTFQIAPENEGLIDGPTFAQFEMGFMERLRALPGVQSVGLVENVPLNEGTGMRPFRTDAMQDADAVVRVGVTFAAGDYHTTMGIALLDGELPPARDLASTLGKVVISKSAAERMYPGERAVGRRVYSVRDSAWFTVIGVVEDVLQDDFRQTAQPLLYLPLVGPKPTSWVLGSPAYVVKTVRAATIAPEIRALAREMAPGAPMYRTFTMAGLAKDSMVTLSFTMLVLAIASGLALILGAVGLYGVLSYVVAQRRREIGVRLALGAEPGQVRRMVVTQGAKVVGAGVAIGLVVAFTSAKVLESLLFEIAPADLTTYAAMSASMLAVGFLASYMPARRASNVDPIESLRDD